MAGTVEVLRLRVLLSFLEGEGVTVTGLSRDLGEEKYTISRLLSALEEEDLVDRSNNRHPVLTSKGVEIARGFSDRVETLKSGLLLKGIPTAKADSDAVHMALDLSDETYQMLRREGDLSRAKYDFRDRRKFTGAEFFANLPDDVYLVSFIIYREKANQVTNVSMANEGFEHPAKLIVENGAGSIELHKTVLNARSTKTGNAMKGSVTELQFFDNGDYIPAESEGEVLRMPAESISFYNLRPGFSPVFHGTLPVRIAAQVGTMQMPMSSAFFTIIL